MTIITSEKSGRIEPEARDQVLTGKEGHVMAQEAPDPGGTPMRAIRNDDFLLLLTRTLQFRPSVRPCPPVS